jgi:serine/threonine protein kinase
MTLHLLSSEKTRNSTRQAAHVQTTASLLYLLLKLYSSIPEHFQQKISFEKCVSYHFQHVEFLRQYYTQLNHEKTGSNANASNPGGSECNGSFSSSSNAIDHKISTWWLCDLMELHMKCLIALAERRKKFPSIERTFRKLQILPLFVSRLLRISRNLVEKAQKKTAEGTINSTISLESEVKTFVPMLSLGGGKKEIRVLPNELENHDEEDDEYTNYKQQKNTYQEANRVISITVSNSLAFSSAGDKIDHVSSATHLDLARLTVPRGSNDVGPKCRSNVALNQRDILEKDMKLHALAVALVLVYITLEPRHTLDPILCPRFFGTDNGTGIPSGFEKVDLLWSLQQHLVTMKASIPSIICVFSELDLCDFLGAQKVEVVRIMLRLLCQSSFDRNFYAVTISKGSNVEQRLQAFNAHQGGNRALVRSTEEEENTRKYLAKGAFSVVYQAIPSRPNTFPVAIKAIKFQKIPGDRSVVHDLFNEVTLLRKLQGNSAAVQMLDFGASEEHQVFEIVTEFCPCTLKEWRQQIEVNPKINNLSITSKSKVLLACLRVFRHTCVALQQIHDDGIVHLDIKCENVFSRSDVQDLTEHTLLSSTTQGSEGNVICFGDFGESIEVELMAVQQDDIENSREVAYLTRSHGTEAIKSPEMLQVKGGLGVDAKEYVTATSDIWSLGCLLYELVTQEFMFVRDNWARFYTHLVKSNDKILRTDHEEKLLDALGWTSEDIQMDPIIGQCFHGLCKFMSSCMTRQPKDRPSIHQLILELDLLIQQVTSLAGSSSDKFNDSGSFSRPSSSA